MADLYGLEASGLPPEHIAALRKAQRQQMIAETLMGQANDPIQTNQTAGGYVVPVSPFQGLAKVAQAYMGAKAMQRGDDAFKGVADKMQSDRQAAIAKIQGALAPQTLPDSSAGPPATMERPIADRRAALMEAIMHPDPMVRGFATQMDNRLGAQELKDDTQRHQVEMLNLQKELATKEQMRREAFDRESQDRLFEHQEKLRKLTASSDNAPYLSSVPTNMGLFAFDHRTGKYIPGMHNGAQLMGAQFDPSLQGQISQSKESGKVLGKATTEAKIDLPSSISKAELATKQIDDLLTHPGFSSAVGFTLRPGASKVDGTPEADFMARLNQVQGGAFLEAFNILKGGGHITEIEGDKATKAINRMNKAQSESEFIAAAKEFQGVIKTGIKNAKIKAGVSSPTSATLPNTLNSRGPAAKAPSIESLLEKYK